MTQTPSSDLSRLVVITDLRMLGWEPVSSGEAGELWQKRGQELAVPRTLDAASSQWNRLAVAVAHLEGESPSDIQDRWYAAVRRQLGATKAQGRPRRRSGSVGRVEMEVHLDGRSVREHETSAYDFGTFVMRAAESIKELVKSNRGTKHHSRNLLIAGGATPGSVQVLFREPDRSDHTALITDPPETAEGVALVYLSAVFSAAEEAVTSPETEGLRARLAPLTVGARQSVGRLATAVADGGWEITGNIRRGSEEAPLRLGLPAALLLSDTARESLEEERPETLHGVLDGWIWSRAELTLISDDRGTVRVSVPMRLQAAVGELNSEPETRVVARVMTYVRLARGTRDTIHTSYVLVNIQREQQQGTI
jgi:hypothetical protein